jgi:hypothetical protein
MDEMHKNFYVAALIFASFCGIGPALQAQTQALCPGQNGTTPSNLACELADATGASGVNNSYLGKLPSTVASQLGQLPVATAVSGSGLTLNRSLGVFTSSDDSLGTILTQRGDTLGRHNLMFSFTYQHFGFGSVDGIPLKNLPTVQSVEYAASTSYFASLSNVSLSIDQYTSVASFGLTDKFDVSIIVPFSKVSLSTRALNETYSVPTGSTTGLLFAPVNVWMPGSAFGIGDVTGSAKYNVFKGERTSIAVGGDVRYPTGNAANYLGTGALGLKPFFVISRHGRLTPNVNLAYQWNGSSILNLNQHLPSSFQYSGGADFRVTPKFTVLAEFMGQLVIDGPRLMLKSVPVSIPTQAGFPDMPTAVTQGSVYNQNYRMDNLGGGFKYSPTKHIFLSASALFKMDDAGLRSKIIPLAGASYRF